MPPLQARGQLQSSTTPSQRRGLPRAARSRLLAALRQLLLLVQLLQSCSTAADQASLELACRGKQGLLKGVSIS